MTQSLFPDMVVTWIEFHKHMVVRDGNGSLLFSTLTQFQHPNLTPELITQLTNHYHKNKMSYNFKGENNVG